MGDVRVLNVDPDGLRKAADGINGVISDISGGALGSYEGKLGRGFSDLTMSGEDLSHPSPKAGFDHFTSRWEWGTRALIVAANDIGSALDLGAGRFELEDQYYANAGKDMLNDLVGDPSLQKQGYTDDEGVYHQGTDDMSLGEMYDYNVNRLTNPDYSSESFNDVLPDIQTNLGTMGDNMVQAGKNQLDPVGTSRDAIDGLFGGDDAGQPPGSEPDQAH